MTAAASVVVIASGGLDSTVLAHHVAATGCGMRLVSFDYGQRHVVELEYAATLASRLGCSHHVVELRSLGRMLQGSALTDERVDVPDGHYTATSMRATVVPNRNAVFVQVAVALAVAHGCSAVAIGVHAGDHAIYPDCRPAFIEAAEQLARVANEGFIDPEFSVLAPFLTWTKTEIVRRGVELGVAFDDTWSCYRGGPDHCGTCGTCVERREAFADAGVPDVTRYVASAS